MATQPHLGVSKAAKPGIAPRIAWVEPSRRTNVPSIPVHKNKRKVDPCRRPWTRRSVQQQQKKVPFVKVLKIPCDKVFLGPEGGMIIKDGRVLEVHCIVQFSWCPVPCLLV